MLRPESSLVSCIGNSGSLRIRRLKLELWGPGPPPRMLQGHALSPQTFIPSSAIGVWEALIIPYLIYSFTVLLSVFKIKHSCKIQDFYVFPLFIDL